MKGWGFCGASYTGYSSAVADEETLNLFPETVQVPHAKSRTVLVNAPGKVAFGVCTQTGGRGAFFQDDRCFVVSGASLDEVSSTGVVTHRGFVENDGLPVTFASNGSRGDQLAIASAGRLFILTLSTNVLALVTDPQLPTAITSVGYIDGYFIVITADRFAISALLDGTNWGADVGQRIGASEGIVGGICDHEVLWLFGALRTEVWYDSGAVAFPFEPVPGVFLEDGLAATHAVARVGDSLIWFADDERGGRRVVRNQGYTAVVVSTPAIDHLLTICATVTDFRAWSEQHMGHTFFVLTSPANRLTLAYDVTEQQWSRRGYWNTALGQWEADRAACHVYAFGMHLVLDRTTNTIWRLSMEVYADGDTERRWLRRSPFIASEQVNVFHQRLEIDAEMGVGLVSGQGSAPTVMLRYSDDGGKTWSQERTATLGALGQYRNRAVFYRLGAARSRVYELSGSDPVKTVIVDAILDAVPGIH